jgi:hypothetical protein
MHEEHKKMCRRLQQNCTHKSTTTTSTNMSICYDSFLHVTRGVPSPAANLLKPIGFPFEVIYRFYYERCLTEDTRDQLRRHPEKFPLFSAVYLAFKKTQEYQKLEQTRQQYLPALKKRSINRANEERAQYTRLEQAYSQASYYATLRFQEIIKKKMQEKGIPNPEKELPTRKRAREEPATVSAPAPVEEQEGRQVKRMKRLNCTMRHTILTDELQGNALQLRSRNIHIRRRAD